MYHNVSSGVGNEFSSVQFILAKKLGKPTIDMSTDVSQSQSTETQSLSYCVQYDDSGVRRAKPILYSRTLPIDLTHMNPM